MAWNIGVGLLRAVGFPIPVSHEQIRVFLFVSEGMSA